MDRLFCDSILACALSLITIGVVGTSKYHKKTYFSSLSLCSPCADEKAISRTREGETFITLERSASSVALFLNPADRQIRAFARGLSRLDEREMGLTASMKNANDEQQRRARERQREKRQWTNLWPLPLSTAVQHSSWTEMDMNEWIKYVYVLEMLSEDTTKKKSNFTFHYHLSSHEEERVRVSRCLIVMSFDRETKKIRANFNWCLCVLDK